MYARRPKPQPEESMQLISNLSPRLFQVWRRNLVVYRRLWQVNFLVPLFEPAFYIMAFGLGFAGLITNVPYAGQDLTYTQFIAPALVATAVMWNSFFETTYASFVRMYYQKTFDAMLATPLSLEEVITAEIVWAATKSGAAAALMIVVLALFGYAELPQGLLAIPVALLGGLAFGAMGMFFTGVTPTIDMFNIPFFLFVTPMFLFSGTFFPVGGLPDWARGFAMLMPLYHLTELSRAALLGLWESSLVLGLAYLAAFAGLFWWLAVRSMRKRLIH